VRYLFADCEISSQWLGDGRISSAVFIELDVVRHPLAPSVSYYGSVSLSNGPVAISAS
jgi:hypothetical protein